MLFLLTVEKYLTLFFPSVLYRKEGHLYNEILFSDSTKEYFCTDKIREGK